MFMRAGFVIGQSGILHALLILFLQKYYHAHRPVHFRGFHQHSRRRRRAYFLISRSLGPEFGGAIGLPCSARKPSQCRLHARVHGSAGENFPTWPPISNIALATGLFLFLISWVGAGWTIKTQYVIMAFLALSIVAFLGGQP